MTTTNSSSVFASTLPWHGTSEVLSADRPFRLVRTGHLGNWRNTLSLCVDIFELRAWRRTSLLDAFLLAAYVAAVAQPVVYGTLGTSIVSLMTPVK